MIASFEVWTTFLPLPWCAAMFTSTFAYQILAAACGGAAQPKVQPRSRSYCKDADTTIAVCAFA